MLFALCRHTVVFPLLVTLGFSHEWTVRLPDEPGPVWKRHTVDSTSQGADGVRFGDLNGNGLTDVVTGWEEGGVVRVYLNPGFDQVRSPWPQVTVGNVKDAEDAYFVDFTASGRLDVVSLTEGKTRTVFRHRFTGDFPDQLLDPQKWRTDPFPVTVGTQMWMQGQSADLDDLYGVDLVMAGKGPGAAIGWLRAPEEADLLADWTWHPLRNAGWVMSVILHDMDDDGDLDVVFSDRKGSRSGVFWLENPGVEAVRRHEPWTEHPIAGVGRPEVMFGDLADLNGDGLLDFVVAVKPLDIIVALRQPDGTWKERVLQLDGTNVGSVKAVRVGDFDGDGRMDLVVSCEGAHGDREGVVWLQQLADGGWLQHRLGGPEGVKFDHLKLLDLDGDGDLDILTCEESDGLGVFWYENPLK
jgi:hypothetical protein